MVGSNDSEAAAGPATSTHPPARTASEAQARTDSEATRTARRCMRIAARRDLILSAAASSMAAHGYERVTLEQIGEAVGLSPTGLYHYVGGKEDILAQLMVDSIDAIARGTESLTGGEHDAELRLSAITRAHLRVSLTTAAGRVLSRHQDIVVSETYSSILRDARRQHEKRFEVIVTDGVAQGVFVAEDPRTTARLILGALNGVPRWCPDPITQAEVDRIADQLIDHVLTGVGTAPRRARVPIAPVAGGDRMGGPR